MAESKCNVTLDYTAYLVSFKNWCLEYGDLASNRKLRENLMTLIFEMFQSMRFS